MNLFWSLLNRSRVPSSLVTNILEGKIKTNQLVSLLIKEPGQYDLQPLDLLIYIFIYFG